jgi:hypothetical protein
MTTVLTPQTSLFAFEIPTPPKEESSLAEKAMRCAVSISAWSDYKYDREASEEIAEIHGAEKDAGRFNKRLLPRKDLEEIPRIVGRARRDHEFMTSGSGLYGPFESHAGSRSRIQCSCVAASDEV